MSNILHTHLPKKGLINGDIDWLEQYRISRRGIVVRSQLDRQPTHIIWTGKPDENGDIPVIATPNVHQKINSSFGQLYVGIAEVAMLEAVEEPTDVYLDVAIVPVVGINKAIKALIRLIDHTPQDLSKWKD